MDEHRYKHKSIQNAAHHIGLDCIHPQTAHGSPYHVHPYPSPVRLQHAFQQHHNNMFHPKGLSKTHMEMPGLRNYGTPSDSPILGRALCFSPRGSPVPGRVSRLSDKFQDSMTLTSDTDALAAKINAMFPTVSETHIKILLKKYYNREAVVISALQVEKHPITTPGPLSMSPYVSRLQKGAMGVYSALQLAKGVSGSIQITPLSGTPHGSPSLVRPASGASSYYGSPRSVDGSAPRPHHSPKMKLRYLKSVFPKAEETLILDVLANKDNNVQQASEELLSMGFAKREAATSAPAKKDKTPVAPKKLNVVKSLEQKEELKKKLQIKYNAIAERVVSIALESVDYNEERAEQILSVVLQEEVEKTVRADRPSEASAEKTAQPATSTESMSPPIASERQACQVWQECRVAVDKMPTKQSAPVRSNTRRYKNWTDHMKPAVVLFSGLEKSFKSHFGISSNGPNPKLHKGPKDCLLLEDYVTWNGPNPELRSESVRPEGPEPRGAARVAALARGTNPALANGPSKLAKGSIYQKLHKKSVKMCV